MTLLHDWLDEAVSKQWPNRIKTSNNHAVDYSVRDDIIQHAPQLFLCLEGEAFFKTGRSKNDAQISLKAGEALYVPPFHLATPAPAGNESYRILNLCAPASQIYLAGSGLGTDTLGSKSLITTYAEDSEPQKNLLQYIEDIGKMSWTSENHAIGSSLARTAFLMAHAILNKNNVSDEVKELPRSRQVFETARTWLSENCQRSVSAEEVADSAGVSAIYLSRLSRKYAGMSPRFIHSYYRMSHARKLLANTSIPLEDVGQQCGYSNKSSFIEAFRKMCLIPPHQYRLLLDTNPRSREDTLRLCAIKEFEMMDPCSTLKSPLEQNKGDQTTCLSAIFCNMSTRTVSLHQGSENPDETNFAFIDPLKRMHLVGPNTNYWYFTDVSGSPIQGFELKEIRCIGVLTE